MCHTRCWTRYAVSLTCCLLLAGCSLFDDEPEYDVAFYTGPPITAETTPGWTASRHGDVITLRGDLRALADDRERPFHDVDTIFITLRVSPGRQPHLEDVWIGQIDGYGMTAERAQVQLQDWNPDEVVSGLLIASLGSQFAMPFWADVTAPPAG